MIRAACLSLLILFAILGAPAAWGANAAETAGDVLQIAIPTAAYGLTFLHEDAQGRPPFYKSMAIAAGITYGANLVIDKEGPDGDGHSFPSGHATLAFAGAGFAQRRYGWRYGLPAYLAATFVGWSRIDADRHEVEDVVAGAAVGVLSAWAFTVPFGERELQVQPLVQRERVGLGLRAEW